MLSISKQFLFKPTNLFDSINTFVKNSIKLTSNRFVSKNSDANKSDDIILTEQLPPIPPNLGYRGDENLRSLFEIKKIKASFRYG